MHKTAPASMPAAIRARLAPAISYSRKTDLPPGETVVLRIGSQKPTQNQSHNHFPKPKRTINEPSTKPDQSLNEPPTNRPQTRRPAGRNAGLPIRVNRRPSAALATCFPAKHEKCHTNLPNLNRICSRCQPSNPLKGPSNPPKQLSDPRLGTLEPTNPLPPRELYPSPTNANPGHSKNTRQMQSPEGRARRHYPFPWRTPKFLLK